MHASYCVISPNSVFTISQNIVYSVLTVELILKHQSGELCFYHLKATTSKKIISKYKIQGSNDQQPLHSRIAPHRS